MKFRSLLGLCVMFCTITGLCGTAYAAPATPVLTVTVEGNKVTASWSSTDTPEGYTLLMAPYPDASTIYQADMGILTSISADLPDGAAYYIAVQSYSGSEKSDYSNVEYFVVSSSSDHGNITDPDQPPSDPGNPPGPDPGTPTNPGDNTDTDNGSSTKSGAYEQNGGEASLSSQSYAATESDQSGIYVYNGGIFNLFDSTVTKSGDTSSADSSNFYGLNAIALSEGGSTVTLSNCSLTSNSEGSNGAFAYGEGSKMVVDNCTITTTKNSSRGVDATFGGSVIVSNTIINTQGDHCAALATDRGEGTITATDCRGTTQGEGSPGIYSTGTFVVTGGSYTAYGSEAATIEGLNSITLTDTDITGTVKRGVMIYQSMSGDSSVGTGNFTMNSGSLTNNSTGPVFFVCNTTAVISLENVTISSRGTVFLKAGAPSADDPDTNTDWGTLGGTVSLSASDQALSGDIVCDQKSSISLKLSGSSKLDGAVDNDNQGDVSLTLEAGASWTSPSDSFVRELIGIAVSGESALNVDAPKGVTIYCSGMKDLNGSSVTATYKLTSGGYLKPM